MTLVDKIQERAIELPLDKQIEVLDFITFLQTRTQSAWDLVPGTERTKRIKKSLEKLAQMHVFTEIEDPVEWQKQIREDRNLPGREL